MRLAKPLTCVESTLSQDRAETEVPPQMATTHGGVDAVRLRALYVDHAEQVWRFLIRMGVGIDDAEDVMQDVFLEAHRGGQRFRGDSTASTWLFGIATRQASSYRRVRWRRRLARLLIPFEPPGTPSDPERHVVLNEAATELQQVLDQMSTKKRAIFVLYELQELDGPAIARIVGCPLATVWTRLHYARLEFHRLLRRQRSATSLSEGRI